MSAFSSLDTFSPSACSAKKSVFYQGVALTMAFMLNRIPLVLVASVFWTTATAQLAWWQKSVFYQIYPRSYQDTDSNGIGDLKGIIQRLEYLKDLGVTGIWMNPFYDSPLKDFGYDISDYRSIDKTFGTFSDFSTLIDKLHSMDMQILVDLVPNHSSSEHHWFKESVKQNEIYKDYYVWHPGVNNSQSENAVPNNWQSVLGGSAWAWDDNRKQYYYHAFLPEQPDLNYRNPLVIEEMKKILKFWLNLGVDGFRVDAVPYLVESKELTDEPYKPGCAPATSLECLKRHIYTQNQDETYEVLAEFYKALKDFKNEKYPGEKIMIVEAYTDVKNIPNYFKFNGRKTSTMPFNFQLMDINMKTNGSYIKNMVDKWTTHVIPGGWSNWVIGNHDQNRVGRKVGIPLADGMNMLLLLLPGTSFSYYGEELGMDDTYVYCFQMQDIQAIRQAGPDCEKMESLSRDPERTPMQWDTSLHAGFSDHDPWLPVNPDYRLNNVEDQKKDPISHLNIYKKLITLKMEMEECKNMTTLAPGSGWVFAFQRFDCKSENDEYVVIVNFFNEEQIINISEEFKLDKMYVRATSRFSNKNSGGEIFLSKLAVAPKEGLVLATSPAV